MQKAVSGADSTIESLRQAALGHPDVEEGLSCKGTTIESATFKVKGKAFLFLRPGTAMLKLDGSLEEASKLAAEKPSSYKVGSGAWVTIALANPKELSMEVLSRWIAESHKLCAVSQKKPAKDRTSKKTR
ncbi:MAG TPA: MmcQ/YjbR family DNA-binding protein [Polyangium sp.]|nr:MmcQ/YjbR family DNA-binding protein [Polyangium sp.]